MAARLHDDQVDVTVEQVRALVAARFPAWRDQPVTALDEHGTETALFRVGDEVVVRFPLVPRPGGRDALVAEQDRARTVAAHVSVRVPEPLGVGGPGAGYPGAWSAYRWIDGRPATASGAGAALAGDVASFVRELHDMGTDARVWEGHGRGGPLRARDRDVRDALAASAGLVDTAALGVLWNACLAAGRDEPDVQLHADLMPGNLLVADGRLTGVLDLGTGGVGDPAVDLMPAWNLFGDAGVRARFRRALGAGDDLWWRGRGWALVQAVVALPYYVTTFPSMADTARRTLANLLTDADVC